jgi:predicted nucleotidyltransferase component of viral defense system
VPIIIKQKMILQKEIRSIAEKLKVPSDTIDKDYVLGHFLNELFRQNWAINNFLFKGGTCLKKCFFEEYRFSEDIDITIIDQNFELTRKQIDGICSTITQKTGIVFNILKFEKTLFKDVHVGWDIEICFWGANHGRNELPKFGKDCHTKIWCEFRMYEKVLFPKEDRALIHLFSDADPKPITIPCYSLQEVLAEKMRALLQRNRGETRDYFDLWYIKTHVKGINWEEVKIAFFEKCIFKNIEYNSVTDFFKPERMKQVEVTWDKRLNHQLPQKLDKNVVMEDLRLFFEDLFKI